MRHLMKSFLALICIAALCLNAGGPIYDPPLPPDLPPFPDDPWPLDPPDMFSEPFDPISDLPNPAEFDFPSEDPFDDPFSNLPDFPDPPLPDDPFPDLPSLFGGEQLGYLPWLGNSDGIATASFSKNPAAATNVLTRLMPFPMRLPFHPFPSGVNAARSRRVCSAATATRMIVPESKRNSVAFVETCPYRVTKRVAVGRTPVAAAGTPDGQFALVANAGSASISIIDIASELVVATIPLPNFFGAPAQPNNIAILPDGSRAYISNHDARPSSIVYIIDLTTRTVTGQVNVGAFPASMAVTPDGTQVWIPCRGDSNLFVIDTLTNTTVGFLQGITLPTGIAINPTGTTVYVAEAPLVGNGTIAVIDPSTFTVRSRIPVGSLPHVVAITPTGRHLFVTNALSDSITQINTSTNRVIRNIPMPGRARRPLGITFLR